ncbi:Glycoside hydrolase [Tenacibaculum litopenaei]|uniref:T9SS type A sorting domain-containing protein n=1 Tax=Tenacibaculum litopenaei TaxID=396016 RepID=UPI0038959934
MKNTLPLLFGAFMMFPSLTEAQESNWRLAPVQEQSNFFEIVKNENNKLQQARSRSDRKSKKQVKQFERWQNFWKDRVLADGSFMPVSHDYNEWLKENQRHAKMSRNRAASAPKWTLVGPAKPPKSNVGFYPGMGRLNTVAFNGTDLNTLYVGSPAGGVWKTTDGGKTWAPKGDNFPNLGVSHIDISKKDPKILYLATGDFDGGHTRSLGVFKSVDAGETWKPTGLSYTLADRNLMAKVLIDPANPDIVLACTKSSIKRTTDGGKTWKDVHTEANAFFNDLQYKTGSSTTVYATTYRGKFLISKDNGATWKVASTPSTARLDMAQTANDPNLIMVVDANGKVQKSTNEGTSWSTVSTIAQYSSQGGYNITIAISPKDKNLVLVGGVEGWRSKNGGTTWEKYLDGYWEPGRAYFYVHSDHHDMMFVPGTNTAISVNDGGIFKGDASLDTKWTDLSSGLAITQYYNVSGTPKSAGKLIMGAQDNDIAIYDGTEFKGENAGSDGVEGLWDYSDSNYAWTCSQNGIMMRTTDGFKTAARRLRTPAGAPFVWELEIHPTDPKTIYGGFGDIYKSTNRGDTWKSLNSGVGTIEFISIAPSNPNVIYVSSGSNVKMTTNGGTSWTNVNHPQIATVKSIEVHPTKPNEVYIAYTGYTAGKVYKSTDSGKNWSNITGSLPNIPTHKIIYKTGTSDGELFLATDLGVYYRNNTKGDWVRLGQGLPNVIVYDLEIHYGTNKLRAATYGRGLWEVSVAASVLSTEETSLPTNAVALYPNPTLDKSFTVKLANLNGDSTILVYNVIGSVVREIKTSQKETQVSLNGFAKGIYLVKVTNNNKSTTRKLIVK